jgi:hypothetical protein
MDWTRENMPNLARLATEGRRPGGVAPPLRFQQLSLNHYRNYDQTKDPTVKARLLNQFKAEDVIYGYVFEYVQAPPNVKPAIREKVHDGVRRMVEALLQERQDRIDRMKKTLAEEEARLADDRRKIEELVDRQFSNRFMPTPPATRPAGSPPPPAPPPNGTLTAPDAAR